jgi:hypothetical protein
MRSVVRIGALAVAVVLAAACSDSSSGPSNNFPFIAGTYTGTITYQMTGDPSLTSPVTPGIAIQLNDPDNNGNFSGTFQFNNNFTGSGDVVGQFASDGNTVNWTQFGDAGEPLFFVGQFLTLNYPSCNFVGAGFTLNPNGGFDFNGDLDLAGTYTGVRCAVGSAGDSDTTNMNVALQAFNPTPSQTVTHALGLHSVLKGGVQHVK